MNVERVPTDSLHFDPANARRHNPENIRSIESSLLRFGQQKPIVVDKSGVVRAGNGTLEAAKNLGWEEIDVVRSELTGADMAAFAIADNRTAELAEWDNEVLAATIQSFDDAEVRVEDLGFSSKEIAQLLKAANFGPDGEEGLGVNFAPGTEDEQGRLDELVPKIATCPHCGGEFDLREHGQD